jgi:hypothetical protein
MTYSVRFEVRAALPNDFATKEAAIVAGWAALGIDPNSDDPRLLSGHPDHDHPIVLEVSPDRGMHQVYPD